MPRHLKRGGMVAGDKRTDPLEREPQPACRRAAGVQVGGSAAGPSYGRDVSFSRELGRTTVIYHYDTDPSRGIYDTFDHFIRIPTG